MHLSWSQRKRTLGTALEAKMGLAGTVAVHVGMKVVGFGFNVAATRVVAPRHKALSFALEMYAGSVGFLCKEAVRNFNGRSRPLAAREDARVTLVRVACVPVLLCVLVALPLVVLRATLARPTVFWDVCSTRVVLAYAAGTAVELLSEPALASDPGRRALFGQLLTESALRLVLAETEKVVLVGHASLEAQGLFAAVGGLGSLVTRLVFRPLEDWAAAMWSLGSGVASVVLLQTLVRCVSGLGLVAVACGPALAPRALQVVFGTGSPWSAPDAAALLGWYCLSIPFAGINGLLEAFVRGTSTLVQLSAVQKWMVLCSLLYWVACCGAVRAWDVEGLLAANCANSVVRALVAARFVGRNTGHSPGSLWRAACPSRSFLAAALLAAIVLRLAPPGLWREALAIGAAAVCGTVFVATDAQLADRWRTCFLS